jgi:hypothetical protein
VPERLARRGFDHRTGQDRQGIADAAAAVRPGAGVDRHGVDSVDEAPEDALARLVFDVGLEALGLGVDFALPRVQPCVDLGRHGPAVSRWITLAGHAPCACRTRMRRRSPDLHAAGVDLPNAGDARASAKYNHDGPSFTRTRT